MEIKEYDLSTESGRKSLAEDFPMPKMEVVEEFFGVCPKKDLAGMAIKLAQLLNSYDEKPSSEKWAAIQKLAREVLK